MKALTEGLRIRCIAHPEWGTWCVIRKYDNGIFEIRGDAGERILFDSEFKQFWEEA